MRRRYIYIEGEMIEVSDSTAPLPASVSHNVIPDIQPYRSMIDGSEITSRSRHRAHLKAHGCIEVGNDRSVLNPVVKPVSPPPGLKETIARAVYDKLRY